jgi:hypothetical protein
MPVGYVGEMLCSISSTPSGISILASDGSTTLSGNYTADVFTIII